jgi:hypothetical protein
VGDCACRSEIAAKPMTEITRRDLMLMKRSLGNREDARQDICNDLCAGSGWLRFTGFWLQSLREELPKPPHCSTNVQNSGSHHQSFNRHREPVGRFLSIFEDVYMDWRTLSQQGV